MSSPERRAYIDWARGVAVLVMIEAHAIDAWTRDASRTTPWFRDATILGGFAAPLFLWLAGVSVALAAGRAAARGAARTDAAMAVCRRGLEIFVLAFVFRFQAFVLSPGSSPLMLFRVDVLNVMGLAIAAAAIMWAARLSSAARVATYGLTATAIALATPIVRASPAVTNLPTWVQWYVRPAGEYTTFTLFPWSGFVFAGAAAGVLIERTAGTARERRALHAIGAAGAAAVALGWYTSTRPPMYAETSFWTSSPTWFAVRAGILMVVLAALYLIERRRFGIPVLQPLAVLGRHSLFVYWIHVELVYGYASWLWWRRLPLWGSAIAYAIFVVLMYRAVGIKGRIERWWRDRRGPTPAVAAAI